MRVYAIVITVAVMLIISAVILYQLKRAEVVWVEIDGLEKQIARLSRKQNMLHDTLEEMSSEEFGSEDGQKAYESYNNYATAVDLIASAICYLKREDNQ